MDKAKVAVNDNPEMELYLTRVDSNYNNPKLMVKTGISAVSMFTDEHIAVYHNNIYIIGRHVGVEVEVAKNEWRKAYELNFETFQEVVDSGCRAVSVQIHLVCTYTQREFDAWAGERFQIIFDGKI